MTAELIERLERGEVGREIDEAVALQFRIVTMWKSKHGYWNVEPKSANMNPTTVHGRPREYEYDPVTGEKLPPEEPPGGWCWDVNLPCYTTSLDAAIALVERVRPGWEWTISKSEDVCLAAVEDPDDPVGMIGIQGRAPHPAAALVAALLRAALLKAEAK